ncbi:MAG: prepilin-type N-terminal cleavage/methylation domain-containing protein [Solirubrobacterales bacterium]
MRHEITPKNCDRSANGIRSGFTLVELLVVIALIALLMAIFVPVIRTARERGQRAVCLSNLRQLTMAWIAYADEHDGKLPRGGGCSDLIRSGDGGGNTPGWMGSAFFLPKNREALLANPKKGALWPYLRDVSIYRCPAGPRGHAATYATVVSANGVWVEGTYRSETGDQNVSFGERVGGTVLRLTQLTDIGNPGAAQRAVFMDENTTPSIRDFYVYYLSGQWCKELAPPTHHAGGVTLTMADGHAEYWKWKARETVTDLLRRWAMDSVERAREVLREDYTPQTEDGLYDLQRLQCATWGRLGYPAEETP